MKNFSSLKAILSALTSEPVFRLKSVWSHVNKSLVEEFHELDRIFSTDENSKESRELLDKVREILF